MESCSEKTKPKASWALSDVTRRKLISATFLSGTSSLWLPLPRHASKAAQSKTDRRPGDWTTPGLASDELDSEAPRFRKTKSGVIFQDLNPGNGTKSVEEGDKVLVDYVLRRSNGYFIYSTVEGVSFQPKDVPIGAVVWTLDHEHVISGLIEGLKGLSPGGKRRLLVPPEQGYADDKGDMSLEPRMPNFSTKRQLENHKREPLVFEVQVLRIL